MILHETSYHSYLCQIEDEVYSLLFVVTLDVNVLDEIDI